MRADDAPSSRAGFLRADGVLLVVRDPPPAPPPAPGQPPMVPGNPAEGVEILLALWDDGSANALSGKVDLGTGVATALGQLVAEELRLPMERVRLLLGDTARAPNQGPTIASATLQIASDPLRRAAAQARAWLDAQAGGQPAALRGRRVQLMLELSTPLRPSAEWTVAGQPLPRVDIPAKVFGDAVYVHDVRVEGMLHGRVVRPPYAGADHGAFIGRTLRAVDRASVDHIPGLVAVVREGDFVGVVADREEQAEAAMHALRLDWGDWPDLPSVADAAQALSAQSSTARVVAERGDAAAANAAAPLRLQRRYVWPYQMHASIGPSCAVAHWQSGAQGDRLEVWAGTQNPHVLRADLALLTGLAETAVEVVRLEAAGCYGRNGADDVAADAALLSRAVGRPVRVQLTREQEHQWEPKGAAQRMDVDGSVGAGGELAGWDFHTCYPSNAAPTLALLLTGRVAATAQAYQMGDRTSVPPYRVADLKVTVHDMAPILRASWLRGVSALPNSFAHECFVDELAHARGEDPLAFRLRHLDDERARELLQATAERAGWQPHTTPGPRGSDGGGPLLKGQGLAWARYVHSRFPGFGAAWSAWVADVEVNRVTGEVHVARVVVGHDAGALVNPAGVQHQVHGNVLQTTSRALLERVETDPERGTVAAREWGRYPILNFRQVPVIEVVTMPRPGEPILGAGESSSVPGTAAIANAIFDATGVRLRDPPFTPEVVRAALNPLPAPMSASPTAPASMPVPAPPARWPASPLPASDHAPPADVPGPRAKPAWTKALALAGGAVAALAAFAGWRPAIAPVSRPDASIYTAATVERGRAIAALGNCAGCHTVPDGVPLAGSRALATPFGAVYSTNLTPDVATGIGSWSFDAFRRAMREGVSRDGRHLFPAFPYTAFTRLPDDELMALYAYLMAQPAVAQATPRPSLAGLFGQRALLPLWNALHLQPGPRAALAPPPTADASRWTRGEYLVNGPGHCGACHTPRDALGAERADAHLAGATIDGWTAPSLRAAGRRTLPWTEATLFGYLKHGHSATHGVASGPMAEVVSALNRAPNEELRAMAHYLVSLQGPTDDAALQRAAAAQVAHARAAAPPPAGLREVEPLVAGFGLGVGEHDAAVGRRGTTMWPSCRTAIGSPARTASKLAHSRTKRSSACSRSVTSTRRSTSCAGGARLQRRSRPGPAAPASGGSRV
jgi:nicotinate dehydrogenase subunit B